MAELKTKKTEADPADFLGKIKDAATRKDCADIAALLQRITGAAAKMWGPSIVGFGSRRLKYPSGREIDWMVAGFSPRESNLTVDTRSSFTRRAAARRAASRPKRSRVAITSSR